MQGYGLAGAAFPYDENSVSAGSKFVERVYRLISQYQDMIFYFSIYRFKPFIIKVSDFHILSINVTSFLAKATITFL